MRRTKKPQKIKKVTTQDLKTKFRRSKAWKDFRQKIKKIQKTDPITGKPLATTYNLHHKDLDSNHYTDISDQTHFIGLNSQSHDVVHYFYGDSGKKKNWRKMVLALIQILKEMEKINGGKR